MSFPATQPGDGARPIELVPDRPIRGVAEDAFGFVAYADPFALLVNDRSTATPLTVAISGPWGSGKTSLARLIEQRLAVEQYWGLDWMAAPLTCWFDAWRHVDSPHIGATLAAQVARSVDRRRPIWRRLISPLPTSMLSAERRWWRRMWWVLIGLAVIVLGLAAVPDLRAALVSAVPREATSGWLWLLAAVPVLLGLAQRTFKVADSLGTFVRSPSAAAAQGSLDEVRTHLGRLIRQALRGRRRLVIFVDNLERCPAEQALGVSEVAGNLLDFEHVVVIQIADTRLLATAARQKYSQPDAESDDIGEAYLHKLIQLHFTLPPLGRAEVGRLFGPEVRDVG